MTKRRGERRQGDRRQEPEHVEQVALFRMAALHAEKIPELGFLYAVPNGRKRHISEGIKLKAEGVKPGYPDIGLDVPKYRAVTNAVYAEDCLYHGLRIEMKAPGRRGTVSDTQITWHLWLKAQRYYVAVCDTWQQAWNEIVRYLGHPELVQPEAL